MGSVPPVRPPSGSGGTGSGGNGSGGSSSGGNGGSSGSGQNGSTGGPTPLPPPLISTSPTPGSTLDNRNRDVTNPGGLDVTAIVAAAEEAALETAAILLVAGTILIAIDTFPIWAPALAIAALATIVTCPLFI